MARYNLRKIMNRAWEIKRENSLNHFGMCLSIAWAEAKGVREMTSEEKIEKLVAAGCKRWTKGKFDRLYINANIIGYEYETYKTSGMVSYAEFRGEKISNSSMMEILTNKSYIDVEDMSIHYSINARCYVDQYKNAVNNFVSGIIG